MFTLFRVATSESWYLILADASRSQNPSFVCEDVSNFEDFIKFGRNSCGSLLAFPFFYSFCIVILLILNLLVGTMINASSTLKKFEEKAVNFYQLDNVNDLWTEFDTKGCGFMNYKDFWKFSSKIALILELKGKGEEVLNMDIKKKLLKLMNIPVFEYSEENNMFCFYFYDVILALCKLALLIKRDVNE